MKNEEDDTVVESQEPQGPKIIIFIDESGEVQVGTKDGAFHPQAMIHILDVAKAKMELLLFNMMMRQTHEAQARPNLVLARQDVRGLNL